MAKIFYKQCKMQQGDRFHIAWIPERFAVANKNIIIDSLDGDWKVIEIGSAKMAEEYVRDRSRDYLRTREASDI